jgi:hypothetical protein
MIDLLCLAGVPNLDGSIVPIPDRKTTAIHKKIIMREASL